MGVLDDIRSDVAGVVGQPWSIADAQVVPQNENVVLAGGAKKLKAAMFYADLADSTRIAMYDHRVAAKLFKAFLATASRVVRAEGGEIRSFDGDRLMAVFVGQYKNTNAVRAALRLKFAFDEVIGPKFKNSYTVFDNGTFPLAYSCGVDSGDVLVVRAGIRNNNDLVWVGRAPNVAAKLSALREGVYSTYITDTVFGAMADETKYFGSPRQLMWEARSWPSGPVQTIYRSSWWFRVH
jgi:class 3 adenylate cyclase